MFNPKSAMVTGHTSGLGAAFYNILRDWEYTVTGFSRSTGHDLSGDLDALVADDFDLYINNAYWSYSQTDLLYKLFEKNKDRNCTILNIGSVSALGIKDYLNEYAVHKKSLYDACQQLQLVDCECRVIHATLGRIATPMTDHRREYPRMDPYKVAGYLLNLIEISNDFYLKDVVLDVPYSRRLINEK